MKEQTRANLQTCHVTYLGLFIKKKVYIKRYQE